MRFQHARRDRDTRIPTIVPTSGPLGAERVDAALERAALGAWTAVRDANEMEHVHHWRGRRALQRLRDLGDSSCLCWDGPARPPVVRVRARELAERLAEVSTDFFVRGISADRRWMLEAERGQDRTVVTLWDVGAVVEPEPEPVPETEPVPEPVSDPAGRDLP